MNVTAEDLVRAINNLPKNRQYHYVNPATRSKLIVDRVELPEGPIFIKRLNPELNQTAESVLPVSMSRDMLWRVANAVRENKPFNVDRILGASYNTRSALEALLAHTPEFYWCKPGRIETLNSTTEVCVGHKHLMWKPSAPHENGVLSEIHTDAVISEIPGEEIVYDDLELSSSLGLTSEALAMERRHAQIQVCLIVIGAHLRYKVWVAQNDRGIKFGDKILAEMDGVLPRLSEGTVIQGWGDAVNAAKLIDCVWFKNGRLMPAVIEIEHTTGVTSGLSRMKNFQDKLPPFPTRYVIAAPDEDRERVSREINKPQFESLDARYFPYSAVEEMYALCTRRKIQGVTEEFLDSYMERMVSVAH